MCFLKNQCTTVIIIIIYAFLTARCKPYGEVTAAVDPAVAAATIIGSVCGTYKNT